MVDSVALFMAMGTQWNWASAGMAGAFRLGLKYEVVDATAAGIGISLPLAPMIFGDLRVMESEALKAWARRRG